MATDHIWTRRDVLRGSALAAGAAVTTGLLTNCTRVGPDQPGGAGLLERIKKQGYVTVGISGEIPAAYKKDGELAGRDPAIHKAVWGALGVHELRGLQVNFDQLIPGLNANRFDLVAVGMFILPERCDQAAFSDPEYYAPEAFLVDKGNPHRLTDYRSAARAGVTLGVLPGAVEGIYARKAGVDDKRIIEIASQRDGVVALKSGRVKAVSLTSPALRWMLKTKPDPELQITKPFVPMVDGKKQYGCGGSVFRKRDKDLLEAFNRELAKLRKSGRLQKLIAPYGYNANVPPEVTTASLCAG